MRRKLGEEDFEIVVVVQLSMLEGFCFGGLSLVMIGTKSAGFVVLGK